MERWILNWREGRNQGVRVEAQSKPSVASQISSSNKVSHYLSHNLTRKLKFLNPLPIFDYHEALQSSDLTAPLLCVLAPA